MTLRTACKMLVVAEVITQITGIRLDTGDTELSPEPCDAQAKQRCDEYATRIANDKSTPDIVNKRMNVHRGCQAASEIIAPNSEPEEKKKTCIAMNTVNEAFKT